ncbi:hypothetical protein F5Y08DRAFT_196801 [Xylaria arbuscula]|uniref:Threonine/serine exporter-like N-terminal domain-containing protein n=1 Tax=Xylaria arbuscula TaxID=114810 RepID=A0A9W8TMH1_9PEZI|nr:hypothetical protein F5Y08DRAFT_196801 [Xylaria arbuscula]KAJ3574997.1 hypothetical protein NPX13_g4185 [Xylaria arbuscula]
MDSGQPPSPDDSRPSSIESTEGEQSTAPPANGITPRKEKGRVRFNSTADIQPPAFVQQLRTSKESQDVTPLKPRPSLLRGNSYSSVLDFPKTDEQHDPNSEEALSARAAQERAQYMAAAVLGSRSMPGSETASIDSDNETLHEEQGHNEEREGRMEHQDQPRRRSSILHDLAHKLGNSHFTGHSDNQEIDHEKASEERRRSLNREAYDLVQRHAMRDFNPEQGSHNETARSSLQITTPTEERDAEVWIPPPQQFRGSTLSHLLKLYRQQDDQPPSYPHSQRSDLSGTATPGSSGATTPTRRKWYDKNKSTDTLANLVEASARLANATAGTESPIAAAQAKRPKRPRSKRTHSARLLKLGRPRVEDEIRITINIAETLSRQKYIIKMCKALMMYGAPTHRLEEYLTMTARVLEIDGQFLYLPGCMIISFDDRQTHTTEVKIVRSAQGIDLGKLKDIHEIYKSVLHDVYGVDEAIERISSIMAAKDKFHPWLRVLVFGLASAAVAPFAFGGRWIDLPICFLLGSMVGALQIIVAPRSALYNNLFEISATILTSFLARAFGSISGGELFCFPALAQSSIALILPGWFVLSSALELQSRALVPGSIRLVYAVIYSLFLGFGITVGTVLYGLFDSNATSVTTCSDTMNPHLAFIFVPIFTVCLAVVNQAKWKQLPVMVVISFAGYLVNFFSSPKFQAAPQIANTLGAFTVGVLANLYSRLRHGVAVTALLPAIFVQVPSGLAATGSLLSGLNAANQINNQNQQINGTLSVPINDGTSNVSDVVFNVAGSMIQIAIGITLGLFLSALIVYPLGKRRSGLWTL